MNRNKKLILNILHTAFLLALTVVMWIEVHWSVAVFCFWLSISVSVVVSIQSKMTAALFAKIKENDKDLKHAVAEFNQFIDTINKQATAVKKEMSICRECEQYPNTVRPGSVHVSHAKNCFMGKAVIEPVEKPPLNLVGDFKPCTLCIAEGNKTTEFKSGNCPIHN